jgi:hypothetical protein
MELCKECYHPATENGLCTYHDGQSIRELLTERGISRKDFRNLVGCSERTVDAIHANRRLLSELEMRGLLSMPLTEKSMAQQKLRATIKRMEENEASR